MFWMQMDSRLLPELLEEMIVQLELMVGKKVRWLLSTGLVPI